MVRRIFTDVAVAAEGEESNTEALAEYETDQRQRAEKRSSCLEGGEEAAAEEAPSA